MINGIIAILRELKSDADTISAASLLYNSEKQNANETISDNINNDTNIIIQGLKKLKHLKTNVNTVQEAQNIRNMIFALTDDIRVIIIKLAEKLHDLRILDHSEEEEKRKTAAQEALNIYAPIADRLGISRVKNEMEDLALKILNREAYQQIKDFVSQKREERGFFLETVRKTVVAEAEKAGLNITVESRAKHFYSIYMKMRKRNKSVNEIFDLYGIRIITGTVENCYTLLGIVHRLYTPVNGCFKDYIARPKPNGYMSLHTSVSVEDDETPGSLLEIQIRSKEMHQIAENGIASHWLYKKGSSRDIVQEREISTINLLKDWKKTGEDQDSKKENNSWLDEIKRAIFQDSIYVFTPLGKVIKLPVGSTPIDFAYHIHTAVGERCIGAKADGSIIPLGSQLKNAQTIEIMTSRSAHPNYNWLEIAKCPRTRSKIRAWLEKNDENRTADKAADTKKKSVSETPVKQENFQASAGQLVHGRQVPPPVLHVRIEDDKNFMIRFARCCNPVPENEITGYVSRGRGIIIHRTNCRNFANNPEVEKRTISAQWDTAD